MLPAFSPIRLLGLLSLAAAGLLAVGCKEPDSIRRYTAPSDPEPPEIKEPGPKRLLAAMLPEGETFANWKAQLVKSVAHSKAAQPIAAAFVRQLPAFAALAGTEDVKSALATPLISSSIKAALGLSSRIVVAEFDRVRAIFGQSYSDSAVWLFVVLGQQMKKETRGWIDAALLEDVHWREAFDNAIKIEQAFESPELKSRAPKKNVPDAK